MPLLNNLRTPAEGFRPIRACRSGRYCRVDRYRRPERRQTTRSGRTSGRPPRRPVKPAGGNLAASHLVTSDPCGAGEAKLHRRAATRAVFALADRLAAIDSSLAGSAEGRLGVEFQPLLRDDLSAGRAGAGARPVAVEVRSALDEQPNVAAFGAGQARGQREEELGEHRKAQLAVRLQFARCDQSSRNALRPAHLRPGAGGARRFNIGNRFGHRWAAKLRAGKAFFRGSLRRSSNRLGRRRHRKHSRRCGHAAASHSGSRLR